MDPAKLTGRDLLVLWRHSEALQCEGDDDITNSVGGQMRHVEKGDRLFVCSTAQNELFLLGVLHVEAVKRERSPTARHLFGSHRADCTNESGGFPCHPARKA